MLNHLPDNCYNLEHKNFGITVKNDTDQQQLDPALKRPRRNTGSGVTLKDLAEMVGVTKVTISRAMNSPGLVSPDTLRRIQDAVRDTGYVPNLVAGSLASNRSKLIVALIPSLSGSVFQETTEAMTVALAEAGFQFLIGQSGYDESREDALLDAVIGRRPAGIVLTGIMHSPTARKRLAGAGVPIVETWDLTDSPIDMLVGFSHTKVGEAAAEYLYQRGSRKAAVITPNDPRALNRSKAFADTMLRLTGRAVPVFTAPAPTHLGNGRDCFLKVLQSHPDTDAVFCGADNLALGVLMEAMERQIKVPSQLKVLGYGDLNFAAHTTPPLTTMHINGTEIGKLAASMLIERAEGVDVEQKVIDVGFRLIERESA
jgi:LacI family gluconate utilization system Gnt-I transcriptional repressor